MSTVELHLGRSDALDDLQALVGMTLILSVVLPCLAGKLLRCVMSTVRLHQGRPDAIRDLQAPRGEYWTLRLVSFHSTLQEWS
jgi:hypothetical protein